MPTWENCRDNTSDAEPATSDKWAPDCLELFVEYGIDPNSFENDEEDNEEEEEEDKPGKFLTHPSCQCCPDPEFWIENEAQEALKFRLPPPKASSKAGGGELQSESVNLKKRKKGKSDTDKNAANKDEDEEARRARKKKKKAEKKARHEAEAAEAAKQAEEVEPPPAPKKRGRPPKPKDGSTTKVTPSHSFDASVFVSIEQPPEMVWGKTH
jgi:hypothetical protein